MNYLHRIISSVQYWMIWSASQREKHFDSVSDEMKTSVSTFVFTKIYFRVESSLFQFGCLCGDFYSNPVEVW